MEQQAIAHDTQGKKFNKHGMRKVFAAVASVLITIVLTACGGGGGGGGDSQAEVTNPPPTTATATVAVSVNSAIQSGQSEIEVTSLYGNAKVGSSSGAMNLEAPSNSVLFAYDANGNMRGAAISGSAASVNMDVDTTAVSLVRIAMGSVAQTGIGIAEVETLIKQTSHYGQLTQSIRDALTAQTSLVETTAVQESIALVVSEVNLPTPAPAPSANSSARAMQAMQAGLSSYSPAPRLPITLISSLMSMKSPTESLIDLITREGIQNDGYALVALTEINKNTNIVTIKNSSRFAYDITTLNTATQAKISSDVVLPGSDPQFWARYGTEPASTQVLANNGNDFTVGVATNSYAARRANAIQVMNRVIDTVGIPYSNSCQTALILLIDKELDTYFNTNSASMHLQVLKNYFLSEVFLERAAICVIENKLNDIIDQNNPVLYAKKMLKDSVLNITGAAAAVKTIETITSYAKLTIHLAGVAYTWNQPPSYYGICFNSGNLSQCQSQNAAFLSIVTQPGNKSVTAGQTATFSVAATGSTPLSYQWKKNGSNIASATSSSYTTPATSIADNGAVYTVSVTNSAGTVTSNGATLTVAAAIVAPTITTQPSPQIITAGQAATFTVTATGSTPLSYQWKKNGSNIANATSSRYTTPATSSADNGAVYTVSVSNSAGTVSSNGARLTVSAAIVAPSITTQPSAQSITAGQTATFSVAATGSTPLSYQWKKNGSNIASATSSSYTTPATSIADNGAVYTVSVSNSAGTVTSNSATLTVGAAASVLTVTAAAISVTHAATGYQDINISGSGFTGNSWHQFSSDGGSTWFNAVSAPVFNSATSLTVAVNQTLAVGTVLRIRVCSSSSGNASCSSGYVTVTIGSGAASGPTVTAAAISVTHADSGSQDISISGSGFTGTSWHQFSSDAGSTWTVASNAPVFNSASSLTVAVSKTLAAGTVFRIRVCSSSSGNASCSSGYVTVTIGGNATGYSLVANASGGTYALTECVKDNTTGLVWEGKTASPATSRLGTSTYTNYDDANSAQKWNGTTFVNPTQTEIDASTNSMGYKNSVNTSALCGYTDWRLPTKEELQEILASSGLPRIDTTWFPNTRASWYWSSSPYVGNSGYAWDVFFNLGVVLGNSRYYNGHVRLVR